MGRIAHDCVTDDAGQFASAIEYAHPRAGQHGRFELQAHPAERNIFEVPNPALFLAGFVHPDHFHQVGAEKACIDSTFVHMIHASLIGSFAASYDGNIAR